MRFRFAGLFALVSVLCLPALADSYASVNFDELTPDPTPVFGTDNFSHTVVYPFATFYGGLVQGSGGNNDYETFDSNPTGLRLGPELTIVVAPGFAVNEVSFSLFIGGFAAGPTDLDVEADGNGSFLAGSTITVPGLYQIDLASPQAIDNVFIYEPYVPNFYFGIDDVAFNPSLAPVGSTPEPPSVALVGTALATACGERLRRRKRSVSTV